MQPEPDPSLANARFTLAVDTLPLPREFNFRLRVTLADGERHKVATVRGIRGGTAFFNNRSTGSNVTMYDFNSTTVSTSGQAVIGAAYAADAYGGTPTRDMLKYLGAQYQRTDASAPIQYGCQRNSAFIVTDGYNTDTTTTAPSYTRTTYVNTAPYTSIPTNSIADIAGALYTNNPRADLPTGLLSIDPTYAGNNPDRNTNLHVNTYAVTVGALGAPDPTLRAPPVRLRRTGRMRREGEMNSPHRSPSFLSYSTPRYSASKTMDVHSRSSAHSEWFRSRPSGSIRQPTARLQRPSPLHRRRSKTKPRCSAVPSRSICSCPSSA